MVTSCSTCQKEERECMWVKFLIYSVFLQFQICRNLRFFSDKSVVPKFQSSQKNVFFQVWLEMDGNCLKLLEVAVSGWKRLY